ncbi:peptide-methionine (R)-S-oxide reductase MsrB [Aureimonas psammosilenae]|uniref:peptide-methionine (R)-S-oxide reductase MsrB n=1 Tax=Aureimonas psammosilenae TaxID=2495496 RepID=UPI001260F455|nr:peptide-methionine (R)-S-oxide reductase MsrB [Aureimonas psammosilenae]
MQRRYFLSLAAAAGAASVFGSLGLGLRRGNAAEEHFPVMRSKEEWRRQLSADQFAILREEATERPFTSPLLKNHGTGIYRCVGCNSGVYSSETKFDSGTGWPSFWEALDGAVGTTTDYKLVYPRTEVHCATCGGHLGHVFDDGPKPTGKRHCINGLVLAFDENGSAAG